MPEDILAQTAPRQPYNQSTKKLSGIGVVIVIILALVLIVLGERFLFDLNRWINPLISTQGIGYPKYSQTQSMASETNALAPGYYISYPQAEKGKYLTYKLLIHSAFAIPIFLLVFLLYFLVKIKHSKEGWRAVVFGYITFAIWMILHILEEAVEYIAAGNLNAAVYIILLLLVVILTPLAIFLQKKHSEKIA